MNRKLTSILLGGASIIAITAILTYPRQTRSVGDPSKFRYLHCPECKREKMFSVKGMDEKCLYCDKPLVGTSESIKQTGVDSPHRLMVSLVIAELLAIMAAIWFVSRPRPQDPEDNFLYINCGKCKQKIRFRRNQVGQRAMCRRCKHTFIYPEEETDDV